MLSKKTLKFITAILVTGFMLFPMTVMAEETIVNDSQGQVQVIQPRLTYIAEAMNDFSIANGTATVDCWVNGTIGKATKAKVIAELQVKSGNNWIAYGTWTDTQNDYEAAVYETKEVKSGNTYRVKATYTVWEGSASEELIIFSDEKTA